MTYRTVLVILTVALTVPHIWMFFRISSPPEMREGRWFIKLGSLTVIAMGTRTLWLLYQSKGRPIFTPVEEQIQSVLFLGLIVLIAFAQFSLWQRNRHRSHNLFIPKTEEAQIANGDN